MTEKNRQENWEFLRTRWRLKAPVPDDFSGVPTLDLNFSPEWEFNFGVGFGLTRRTDDLMVKLIVGRRF